MVMSPLVILLVFILKLAVTDVNGCNCGCSAGPGVTICDDDNPIKPLEITQSYCPPPPVALMKDLGIKPFLLNNPYENQGMCGCGRRLIAPRCLKRPQCPFCISKDNFLKRQLALLKCGYQTRCQPKPCGWPSAFPSFYE